MNASSNLRKVSQIHPPLKELLTRLVSDLADEPVQSIILTGGIALGDFSPQMSDIDIVIAVAQPLREYINEIKSKISEYSDLKYYDKLDVKLVEEIKLQNESPVFFNVDGSRYKPHEIDLILLRDYSVILWGKDCRDRITDLDLESSINVTIEHLIRNILPRVVSEIENNPPLDLREYPIAANAFLMSRCICTLYTNKLVSKPESAVWLQSNLYRYPFLSHLSDLVNRFSSLYTSGYNPLPENTTGSSDFFRAVASFLSGVLHHKGVNIYPENLLDGDMFNKFSKFL